MKRSHTWHLVICRTCPRKWREQDHESHANRHHKYVAAWCLCCKVLQCRHKCVAARCMCPRVLQCVAGLCRVLQCVARASHLKPSNPEKQAERVVPNGTTSVLQRAVVDCSFCRVMQGGSWCLQGVALCCRVCHSVFYLKSREECRESTDKQLHKYVAGCCRVMLGITVRCSALQCVAVCCTLRCTSNPAKKAARVVPNAAKTRQTLSPK